MLRFDWIVHGVSPVIFKATTTTTTPISPHLVGDSGWTIQTILTVVGVGLTALFTGWLAVITWLALKHGRVLAGRKKPIRVLRANRRGYVDPVLWRVTNIGRAEIRTGWIPVFNDSDVRQVLALDRDDTRLLRNRAHLVPLNTDRQIAVPPHEGTVIPLRFRAEHWKDDYRDTHQGFRRSNRRYGVRFVAELENGEVISCRRRIHLYDLPEGPSELDEIKFGARYELVDGKSLVRLSVVVPEKMDLFPTFADSGVELCHALNGSDGRCTPQSVSEFSLGLVEQNKLTRILPDGTLGPTSEDLGPQKSLVIVVKKDPARRSIGELVVTITPASVDEKPLVDIRLRPTNSR